MLRTPADLLLEQEIILPLTAEQDLQRVVTYEMDRLTPFRAEQVFWTCLAGLRDTARNRLHVRLTIIPRRGVEPVLTALRQAGLIATRIEAGATAEARRVIPLAEERTGRRWLGPRAEAYALGGCGVLAVAAVALPFVLQSLALSDLDARIEAVQAAGGGDREAAPPDRRQCGDRRRHRDGAQAGRARRCNRWRC